MIPARMHLDPDRTRHLVEIALREDLEERGDITSEAVVPEAARATGTITAKEPAVLAGIDVARATFRALDPECTFTQDRRDGERAASGDAVLGVTGRARALLAAERTALNFLQRMCGIATLTREFADAVRGTGAVVLETRKTGPGLRYLEKYAVRVGGGENHRFGLFDRVLLKENHFALSGNGTDPEGYRRTVQQVAAAGLGPITAEVRSLDEATAAFAGGADILLLDNMDLDAIQSVVQSVRELSRREGRDVLLEASGGITLENAGRVAASGVDRLSVGALTHSARAIDLSMLIEGEGA